MPYIDAIESSLENYKLIKWHGDNRLIEFTLKVGSRDSLHSHQESIVYFLRGGKISKHERGGEISEEIFESGSTTTFGTWMGHFENAGDTDIHALIFEVMHIRSAAGG